MRSSWSVHPQQVSAVLDAFIGELTASGQLAAATSAAAFDVTDLAAKAKRALLEHDDAMCIQYLIREPAPRLRGKGPPLMTTTPHGMARFVRVRPLGWDAVLSMDGLRPLRLPSSCMVTLEIEPDRGLWLHAATFE